MAIEGITGASEIERAEGRLEGVLIDVGMVNEMGE